MTATATSKTATAKTTPARKAQPAKAQPAKAAEKPNEANTATAQPAKKVAPARRTGVVKANAFAELMKANGYDVTVRAQGDAGATVKAVRGREEVTFVWDDHKLVIKPLPVWVWKDEKGEKPVKTLIVHNVGEMRRIAGLPADEVTPEKAAAVRNDATITGTNRPATATA